MEVKEVKFRPTIDEHDYERKLKRARAFLRRGKKVKCTVFFRLRQLRRPDLGAQILEEVSAATSDVGEIETKGGLDGRRMTLVLAPRN